MPGLEVVVSSGSCEGGTLEQIFCAKGCKGCWWRCHLDFIEVTPCNTAEEVEVIGIQAVDQFHLPLE